jgi:hypothetical protein
MRRITIFAITALALLWRLRRALPAFATCLCRSAPRPTRVYCWPTPKQIYIVKEHFFPYNEPEPVVRGCARGQKRSYFIGEAEEHPGGSEGGGSSSVKLETLAGPVVAYTPVGDYVDNGKRQAGVLMVVRNLRTGSVLHTVTTNVLAKPDAGPDSVGPIDTMSTQ